MKIVYSLDTLSVVGGLERVTVIKANALAALPGNEVYIIVSYDGGKDIAFELSPAIHLIDLSADVQEAHSPRRGRMCQYYDAWRRKRARKTRLLGILDEISPDVVVSVGRADRNALASVRNRKWKLVREIHGERNHHLKHAKSFKERLMVRLIRFYDEQFNMRRTDKVVLLTPAELDSEWRGRDNFTVIPNPVSFKCETPSALNEKRVISVGRLVYIKNNTSLVNVFKAVVAKHGDWRLEIYGDGPERKALQQQIDENGLQDNVLLMGNTSHIQEALTHSSIFAMTSLSEGFPLVLLEAEECGLPLVAFDCPTGPSDIIADGENGYLVPLNDERMMTERICALIEDRELRERMGRRAREKAGDYQVETIRDRWMSLFGELVNSSCVTHIDSVN